MSNRKLAWRTGAASCVAIGLILLGGKVAGQSPAVKVVNILDRCDPVTFNNMFGAGTCVSDHPGVNVDAFLKILGNAGQIGAWHFAPGTINLRNGQAFQPQNDGGELHTFTEVDQFGGGFIQELNDLTGNPIPANECLDIPNLEFIPPGASGDTEVESPGQHKYQCCIHPWMRATVTVR